MRADLELTLRRLGPGDLEQANAVVEAVLMTWDLPARVKRLSLQSYRYHAHDLDHLTLIGAENTAGRIVAVAAREPAKPADSPKGSKALLLHGLYVAPELHRSGVGSRLLDTAVQAARTSGFDGLLVKANRDAQGFFLARGLRPLPVESPDRDYPYRFWMDIPLANGDLVCRARSSRLVARRGDQS